MAEQTAVAKREVEQAAASVAGLAFEDKLRLITALQPEPLAALVGMCYEKATLWLWHKYRRLPRGNECKSSIAACQAKPGINMRASWSCCSSIPEDVTGEEVEGHPFQLHERHVCSDLR